MSKAAGAGGASSAALSAPSNKKRRLSVANKESMKLALASQEEERLVKEKLGEIVRLLKSAPYQTLLAVSAFLEERCHTLPERVFPRCVKYYGGASNRSVPMKVIIEVLAACTRWDTGNMRMVADFQTEMRCLYLYGLGKEENDEIPEVGMSIKAFTEACIERYEALGSRLRGLCIETKVRMKASLSWQGADGIGFLFLAASPKEPDVPTHVVHRPTFANTNDMKLAQCELPKAFQTKFANISIVGNHSMQAVELHHLPDGLHWSPPKDAMLKMYADSIQKAEAAQKAKEDIIMMKVSSGGAGDAEPKATEGEPNEIKKHEGEPSEIKKHEGADEEIQKHEGEPNEEIQKREGEPTEEIQKHEGLEGADEEYAPPPGAAP